MAAETIGMVQREAKLEIRGFATRYACRAKATYSRLILESAVQDAGQWLSDFAGTGLKPVQVGGIPLLTALPP